MHRRTRTTARRHRRCASALFDLARGRQALLSVAQPALGACIALGRLPDPRVVVVGLVAATAGYLAVFSLNDVLDPRVDELSLAAGKDAAPDDDVDTVVLRHPLAQGVLSRGVALAWVGSLAVVALARRGRARAARACSRSPAPSRSRSLYCALRSVTLDEDVRVRRDGRARRSRGLGRRRAARRCARCPSSSCSRCGRSPAATCRTTSPTSRPTRRSACAPSRRPSAPPRRRARPLSARTRRRWRVSRCRYRAALRVGVLGTAPSGRWPSRRSRWRREPTPARAVATSTGRASSRRWRSRSPWSAQLGGR